MLNTILQITAVFHWIRCPAPFVPCHPHLSVVTTLARHSRSLAVSECLTAVANLVRGSSL